jgi:hypothetical protein
VHRGQPLDTIAGLLGLLASSVQGGAMQRLGVVCRVLACESLH